MIVTLSSVWVSQAGVAEAETSNLRLRRWGLRNPSANGEKDKKTQAKHHLSLFLISLWALTE